MRTRIVFVILLALVVIPSPIAAKEPSPEYTNLLTKLKSGDTSIDFARLRLSYMDSAERNAAKDTSEAEKAMFPALNAKDFAKALKLADTVIASEYVNIDAHFVAYVAHHELKEEAKAEFHHAVFRGLVKSILDSGDGKSTEKAWVVIAVHEEYVILRILGVMPSRQSVSHKDGHSYDVMEVKDQETGSNSTFYFNVDIPFKHYM